MKSLLKLEIFDLSFELNTCKSGSCIVRYEHIRDIRKLNYNTP